MQHVPGGELQQIVVNQLLADFLADETEGIGESLGLGFLAEEDVLSNPGHGEFKDVIASAIRSEDNLDKDVLRQVKRNIESSNARLIERYGDSMPSSATLNKLTEALRGVFQQAVRQSIADLEEAKQAAAANQRIQDLLERESIQDAKRGTREGFLQLMEDVNSAVSRLTRQEEGTSTSSQRTSLTNHLLTSAERTAHRLDEPPRVHRTGHSRTSPPS